jgi:hypothetical protein
MNDRELREVGIEDIDSEDGARELANSANMEPYLRLIGAGMDQEDTTPHVEALVQLPLEKRYVWRIASALKWGFADFDSGTVAMDRDTLSEEDLRKVVERLNFRPIQFCKFVAALLGEEAMERLMNEGIASAKRRG